MSPVENKPSHRVFAPSKFGPTYPDVNPMDANLDEVDFEIIFYEGIRQWCPDFQEVLGILANHYTNKGFIDRGLEADLQLVRLDPSDSIAHYNLACSYALTENIDGSFRELEEAFDLGYDDLTHLATDPDLEILRGDKRFNKFLKKHFPSKQMTV